MGTAKVETKFFVLGAVSDLSRFYASMVGDPILG